jgi:hypothetical protein
MDYYDIVIHLVLRPRHEGLRIAPPILWLVI